MSPWQGRVDVVSRSGSLSDQCGSSSVCQGLEFRVLVKEPLLRLADAPLDTEGRTQGAAAGLLRCHTKYRTEKSWGKFSVYKMV